jgi:hypothetical protein
MKEWTAGQTHGSWQQFYFQSKGTSKLYENIFCFVEGKGCTPLLLCVGTVYGRVSVWALPDAHVEEHHRRIEPQLVMQLQGHLYHPVTSLSVHRDGLLLASGQFIFVEIYTFLVSRMRFVRIEHWTA